MFKKFDDMCIRLDTIPHHSVTERQTDRRTEMIKTISRWQHAEAGQNFKEISPEVFTPS